jgi:hypothetical protein
MTLDTLREIIRTCSTQEALGQMLIIRGISRNQFCEILMLAQFRLWELESKRACDNPPNPS